MSIIVALRLHVDEDVVEFVLHGFRHHRIHIHLGQFVKILDRLLHDPNRLIHVLAQHVQVDATQTALHNVGRDVGQHFC